MWRGSCAASIIQTLRRNLTALSPSGRPTPGVRFQRRRARKFKRPIFQLSLRGVNHLTYAIVPSLARPPTPRDARPRVHVMPRRRNLRAERRGAAGCRGDRPRDAAASHDVYRFRPWNAAGAGTRAPATLENRLGGIAATLSSAGDTLAPRRLEHIKCSYDRLLETHVLAYAAGQYEFDSRRRPARAHA